MISRLALGTFVDQNSAEAVVTSLIILVVVALATSTSVEAMQKVLDLQSPFSESERVVSVRLRLKVSLDFFTERLLGVDRTAASRSLVSIILILS